jgi:hypothetical protein
MNVSVSDQFAAVLSAPLPFGLALLAVSVAMWGGLKWAFHWRYDGVIEQLNATLRLIGEENRIAKETEAKLTAKVKELETGDFKDRKDVIQDLSRLTAQLGQANTAVDDAVRRGATLTIGGSPMFPQAGTPLPLRASVSDPNPPPPPSSPPRKPGS